VAQIEKLAKRKSQPHLTCAERKNNTPSGWVFRDSHASNDACGNPTTNFPGLERGRLMITHIWSVTLTVSDLERAIDFYENKLGLTKKYQFNDYAGFQCGGSEIGVKTWGELHPPREGEPCIDLAVVDVDETYRSMLSKGVEFSKPPENAPWGSRIATFKDPDGNTLQLTQIDWERYRKISAR
jgi:predicted enzyme related to lactoylglutathione lyase